MSFKNESLEGGSIFTLFRFASIRFMTFVAFYAWLVCGVGYYALTVSASGPSRFENTFPKFLVVDLLSNK